MNDFQVTGYEDLELSTQILISAALDRGISVEVLDRQDNFIRLEKAGKIEYIKQATKTSKDSYITALIMENKVVTKKILEEQGFRVPKGASYVDIVSAMEASRLFVGRSVVIKPKSTNFGIGISILDLGWDMSRYEKAVKEAFSYDDTVIIEEFISGKEYRFLVIGDSVVAVLHRVPANVVGDGHSTVGELIDVKNQHPFRGTGHKTPLENIEKGAVERDFLEYQGLSFDSVIPMGKIIYLRMNSNISTGGDSIDFTEEVHEGYKMMALNAAKSVGAGICGVDVMIEDVLEAPNDKNHGIIELNFNPVLYFHDYPYVGRHRNVAQAVLDLLGY